MLGKKEGVLEISDLRAGFAGHPVGQQKTTRGSWWPYPRVARLTRLVNLPDPWAFRHLFTRPDHTREL